MSRLGALVLPLLLLLAACVPPPSGGRYPSRGRVSAGDEYGREEARLRGLAEQRYEEQRARVERVARRLLAAMPDPPQVQFVVVPGDPNINAGATFGQVGVTAGLLNFVEDDDELAVVLAHELAHINEGHVMKGVVGGLALNILAIVAETQLPGSGQAVGGVGQLFLNRFTQSQERAADDVGIRLAYQAGYDPRAAVAVQERLAVEVPQTMAAGYFNTHPSSVERAMTAKQLANELLASGPPPGRDGVLAEMRATEGRSRRTQTRPSRGYEVETEEDDAEDGGYALPPPSDRRHVRHEEDPEAEPEATSEECARARVYRDMADDAGDPSERDSLLARARRLCPESP
jgi:Zn-dependent protease with chaperone function